MIVMDDPLINISGAHRQTNIFVKYSHYLHMLQKHAFQITLESLHLNGVKGFLLS